MKRLKLRADNKPVSKYYREIKNLAQLNLFGEGAVSPHFAALLRYCASQFEWTLSEQHVMKRGKRSIRPDGALLDRFSMVRGVWEAKDSADKLAEEVKKKFAAGYPKDNILFQSPKRVILWQDGEEVLDTAIDQPRDLVRALRYFFEYEPPALEAWEQAVEDFKDIVPMLAEKLLAKIDEEYERNKRFIHAFDEFTRLCQRALNPNISKAAIKEMLIQHLLTERIFRRVFDNSDFTNRNIIAREIEKVIYALTSQFFNRKQFLKDLDHLYNAIESTAATIDDYSEKQSFLNTVYEKFFQGFSIDVADTHGIVYTPQPIVDFMVRSVDEILKREFGRKNGLGSKGVHILDPFVGTGNFMLRVMREMSPRQLMRKYEEQLHCNEVMLLPYYIASMNIEHEYNELTNQYKPFNGICLVDTFELVEKESRQMALGIFTEANSERVQRQQDAPIFVVIGNPPYNAGQVNENDNNKNRQYPILDQRVRDTYAKDSKATLVRKLNDPYVKAFRWASDRIGEEGVVAFVTNNSFIEALSFDGMRKHLAQDFDRLYILDLKGNIRKDSMRDGIPLGEQHTVFGLAAMVGITVAFLVKGKHLTDKQIFYNGVDFRATRADKFALLEAHPHYAAIDWQSITPNKKHTWLTEGLHDTFETFLPIGTKKAKQAKNGEAKTIFKNYSLGISTNRDAIAYDFKSLNLEVRMKRFSEDYNLEVLRYRRSGMPKNVDEFVSYKKIKWSRNLKRHLKNSDELHFRSKNIRLVQYRPFTSRFLYFADIAVDELGHMLSFLPTPEAEVENRVICVSDKGHRAEFSVLAVNQIPDLHLLASRDAYQCFPFYTYDEDGTNRQENITDWALEQFRNHYHDNSISKWDIFHYVYGLLHHPDYRSKYEKNLKQNLPHIPYAPDFHAFARAGQELATLHVGYEDVEEYELEEIENTNVPLTMRVEKMKLSKDKTRLKVNNYLSLAGIPPQAFDYKLGNRSALEWVINQYRVKTHKRSGITNDPNRPDNPDYIIQLVGKVITVSVETVRIVQGLPELEENTRKR